MLKTFSIKSNGDNWTQSILWFSIGYLMKSVGKSKINIQINWSNDKIAWKIQKAIQRSSFFRWNWSTIKITTKIHWFHLNEFFEKRKFKIVACVCMCVCVCEFVLVLISFKAAVFLTFVAHFISLLQTFYWVIITWCVFFSSVPLYSV